MNSATIVVDALPKERSCRAPSPVRQQLVLSALAWLVTGCIVKANLGQILASSSLLALAIVISHALPRGTPRFLATSWAASCSGTNVLLFGLVALLGGEPWPSPWQAYCMSLVASLTLLGLLGLVVAVTGVLEHAPVPAGPWLLGAWAGAALGGWAASWLGGSLIPAGVTLGALLGVWAGDGKVDRPTDSLEVLVWLVPWSAYLGLPFNPQDAHPWVTCSAIVGLALVGWMAARLVKGLPWRRGRLIAP